MDFGGNYNVADGIVAVDLWRENKEREILMLVNRCVLIFDVYEFLMLAGNVI